METLSGHERIYKLRDELRFAIDQGRWAAAHNRALDLIRAISLLLEQGDRGLGKPHLDGLYQVGTARFERAPERSKAAIAKFNKTLKEANLFLERKNKKRKKAKL